MSAKKILVLVDPTTNEQQPVVDRAAWLAEKTGAALELFACDYDANIDAGRVATVWVRDAGARERLLLRHRQKLDGLAGPLRERGLSVVVMQRTARAFAKRRCKYCEVRRGASGPG